LKETGSAKPKDIRPRTVVLGAGTCGLAAGWELTRNGYPVTVLEKKADIGGLTGRTIINNNIYEYGTHVFHTDNQTLKSELCDLMGSYLFEFDRGSRLYIKFFNKYFRYPLNGADFIKGLPFHLLIHCGFDFIIYSFLDIFKKDKYANGEEVLVYKFGRRLYEIFFRDYSAKQWGRPLTELDAEFVKTRITRGDIFKFVKDLLEKTKLLKKIKSHPLTESVIGKLYYTEDGIYGIPDRLRNYIKSNGGEVKCQCEVEAIVPCGEKVRIMYKTPEGVKQIEADQLISSIPLPVFIKCFSNVPAEVKAAAERLHFRALIVLGLLVNKRPVTNAICFYFQDKVYNRLAEPTNHGLRTASENTSILLLELACDLGDKVWDFDDDLAESMIQDLIKEKFIERKDIIEYHKLKISHAYPVYHVGYQDDLKKVLDYVHQFDNIQSVGRQGQFSYVNIHKTMQMGMKASENIIRRNTPEVKHGTCT